MNMKKRILSLLLSMALLGSVGATVALPASGASADGTAVTASDTPTEKVNHAAGARWEQRVGTPTVTLTENGALVTGVKNAWDSAGVDILPALKAALGDRDGVTVRLTFEMRATLKTGHESDAVSARPLLRGTKAPSSPADGEWQAAYLSTLGGDSAVFAISGANVMAHFYEGSRALPHAAWQTYETVLALTKNQIESPLLTQWVLCVDSIGGVDMIESMEFRNLTLCEETSGWDDTQGDSSALPLPEYEARVWSPVEINLQSTVSYRNPYVETEIDAVFTHTDGTVITLPGFWKGGRTWAARFSPTKEGDWSYRVTCKDTANTGLFAEGVIHAAEATGDTAIAEHGFITAEPGTHYYRHADGTPFFWLGDTNWQAFSNVSTTVCNYPGCDCGNQFKHIVDNRVDKGFTVYQTYFVPESGNGEPSVWLDGTCERPDTAVFNGKVDEMFAYLHERGMTVALGLGCHTSTPARMDLDDFLRFTRYVVARYACYSVVWISGQEINIAGDGRTPGYTSMDYYMTASALIETLDGYGHPNSAHMYPVMADEATAVRMDTAEWHDSWTVQGGHGNLENGGTAGFMQSREFYKSYYTATGSGKVKPFVESESNYEDINCGLFTGYDANRVGAWRAMLCGSAGFTYGVTGIWAGCFSTDTYTGWYNGVSSYSYEPWYIGLDKPGSFEVAYMKQFFETIGPWHELVPQFFGGRVANFVSRPDAFLSATEDASILVAYFFGDRSKTGTICILDEELTYDAYWFNPRSGKFRPVAKGITSDDGDYTIPEKPDRQDWVFLLTARGLGEHYEETPFTDLNPTYAQVAPTGSVVTPVDVKAVGGISYKGAPKDRQVMTDNTLWLYDGDPTTVWTPTANRTTQTFLFDLGTAQKLTHIQIKPVEGTIIPTFRVEGSNDGVHWTIITDTGLRDVENPGACSEPLQGTYRYVKVLLHNAKSENVAADELDTLPYKAMFNPMNNLSYSVTEIEDVLIYSNGEGEPTPEILVGAPVDAPEEPDEPETETEPETQDSPADTSEPDAPNEPAETEQPTDTDKSPVDDGASDQTTAIPPAAKPEEKGCSSAVGAGIAAMTVAVAALAVLLLRKRED